MAEIGLESVTVTFGGAPLLESVSLQVERGERVGLLGRNGSGKSTLLGVLAGRIVPDEGSVIRRQRVRVAGLAQEVPRTLAGTALDAIRAAAAGAGTVDDWRLDASIERVVELLGIDPSSEVAVLSAGAKRRVLLAGALAAEPDVLLLDEPTNHLDVDTIRALEEHLLRAAGALVLVTHDRAFLRAVATRILDLDRARVRSFACGYEQYLERKQAVLEAERHEALEFEKKLAAEEVWIRRGIEARRTRNMGRVRALKEMRAERAARREETGRVRAAVTEAARSGRIVVRAEGLRHAFDGRELFGGFDLEIQRGDRLGIVGPNGCGKTTLVRILLGELAPDSGTVTLGTNLAVARFDQLGVNLDLERSVQENLAGDGDTVFVGGAPRNVIGYLKDFLFRAEQARDPVARLSGGERNRLQLAKILARPCNLLVLDEPTNDLDLETLELLEELLADFQGTVILVSHDRAFLDDVATSVVVFDGGLPVESVGGWSDWIERRRARAAAPPTKPATKVPARAGEASPRPRKLTYGEKLELDGLPARIEALESAQAALQATLSDPAFFRGKPLDVAAATTRLAALEGEIAALYARWELLASLPA
ncbi:MAG: ATP-binding cassette domain-containing protein [Planctomycetes bacterium]|nr:ATP-binding cassette domain-containing protein [Planctomycetota bacterium]